MPLRGMREPDLLRIMTAGSVDDGKSTMIGRLLYDADALYDDHVAALCSKAAGGTEGMDFALVTDGLKAEREQGITIDVAYRYFSTDRRRFIIADAPGHEQYTRNMATAATSADLAILLIDARQGVVTQSRRHAFICALLGVPRLVVAVNKMDLVDYSEDVFSAIEDEYAEFALRLGLKNLTFIPISALKGDNVVTGSTTMPWYAGPTLLAHLEEVYVAGDRNLIDFRLPVQSVIRSADYRGYCGQIPSGIVRSGDEVVVLPSGVRTRVRSITTTQGEQECAWAGQSVAICLENEVDAGRGSLMVHPGNMPRERRVLESMLVWTGNEPLVPGATYWLKHSTNWVKARCEKIHYRVDPNSLRREQTGSLELNDIGRVRFSLFTPLYADEYRSNRILGAFIVASQNNNDTLAAATIVNRNDYDEELKTERAQSAERAIVWHSGQVKPDERTSLMRQRPATLWLTGLSGSGKSTISFALERRLMDLGHAAYVLDGDNIRHGLTRDLGFSPRDRAENIRRIAEVARLMNDAGLIVITAFISPYREDREMARSIVGNNRFLEVHLATSIQICEQRDPKGLYKRARKGEIPAFTGVSAPYETPLDPVCSLDSGNLSIEQCVDRLIGLLKPYLGERS